MDKCQALISTGRLEILIRVEPTELLNEVENLQRSIIENDTAEIWKRFNEIQKKSISRSTKKELEFLKECIVQEKNNTDKVDLLDMPISMLEMSKRVKNVLLRAKITTVQELIGIPMTYFEKNRDRERNRIHNLGPARRKEIFEVITRLGLMDHWK